MRWLDAALLGGMAGVFLVNALVARRCNRAGSSRASSPARAMGRAVAGDVGDVGRRHDRAQRPPARPGARHLDPVDQACRRLRSWPGPVVWLLAVTVDQAVVAGTPPAADRHRVSTRRGPRLAAPPGEPLVELEPGGRRPTRRAHRRSASPLASPAPDDEAPAGVEVPGARRRRRLLDRRARRTAARCRRGRRRRTCARGRASARSASTHVDAPAPAAGPARACRGRRRRRRPRCPGGPARCRPGRCRSRRRARVAGPKRGDEVGLAVHGLAGRGHPRPTGRRTRRGRSRSRHRRHACRRHGTSALTFFGTHIRHASRTSSRISSDVDRGEAHDDPLVAQVGRLRQQELLRLGGDQGVALVLREPEAHQRLVAGERDEHDAPDAELDAVADEHLVGTRERERERPDSSTDTIWYIIASREGAHRRRHRRASPGTVRDGPRRPRRPRLRLGLAARDVPARRRRPARRPGVRRGTGAAAEARDPPRRARPEPVRAGPRARPARPAVRRPAAADVRRRARRAGRAHRPGPPVGRPHRLVRRAPRTHPRLVGRRGGGRHQRSTPARRRIRWRSGSAAGRTGRSCAPGASATAGSPGARRSTRRSPPRRSSTRPPPRPAATISPEHFGTNLVLLVGRRPPAAARPDRPLGRRRVLQARRAPGDPTGERRGARSCAASPTTCSTSRHDAERDDDRGAHAARRAGRRGLRQRGVGLGRRARRAAGDVRRHRRDRTHGVPDRLDDEELHGGDDPGPARRRRAPARRRGPAAGRRPGHRRLAADHVPPPAHDELRAPRGRRLGGPAHGLGRRPTSKRSSPAACASPTRPARRSSTPTSATCCWATGRRTRPPESSARSGCAARRGPGPSTTTGRARRHGTRSSATARSPAWAGSGRASRTWRGGSPGSTTRSRRGTTPTARRRPAVACLAPGDAADAPHERA